jgi:hypothetical protein
VTQESQSSAYKRLLPHREMGKCDASRTMSRSLRMTEAPTASVMLSKGLGKSICIEKAGRQASASSHDFPDPPDCFRYPVLILNSCGPRHVRPLPASNTEAVSEHAGRLHCDRSSRETSLHGSGRHRDPRIPYVVPRTELPERLLRISGK